MTTTETPNPPDREETPEETHDLLRHLDQIARSISEATEESRS